MSSRAPGTRHPAGGWKDGPRLTRVALIVLLVGVASPVAPMRSPFVVGAQQAAADTVPAATPVAPEDTPTEPALADPAPALPTPIMAKETPTLTLAVAADVTVGEPVRATATLSDGDDPIGSVTYMVFVGDGCVDGVYAESSVELISGADVSPSDAVTFGAAGTYSWQAAYSGDATNESAVSACIPQRVNAAETLALTVTRGRNVSFGLLATSPNTATTTNRAVAPTYVMNNAVTVEVTGATGPWVMTCSVAGGDDGMELAWQLAGSTEWAPFGDGPCYTSADGGDRTLTFHYRLSVDPAADPGRFAFEVTYEVTPL